MSLKDKTSNELMKFYQLEPPLVAYEAFDELYRRYGQRVFSYLNKKLKNYADAEDVLQKVFIKVHESKHLFNEKYNFEQWIFVIARSAAIDHFRMKSREQKNSKLVELDQNIMEFFPELHLDKDQLELLELKYIDELSYKELSRILNKSEISLRKLVSRITSNLRRKIV